MRSKPEALGGQEDSVPATTETSKPKFIACGDVVPGCTFTASASTEDALLERVIEHAAHEHGVTKITPELAAKVKAAIKTR